MAERSAYRHRHCDALLPQAAAESGADSRVCNHPLCDGRLLYLRCPPCLDGASAHLPVYADSLFAGESEPCRGKLFHVDFDYWKNRAVRAAF